MTHALPSLSEAAGQIQAGSLSPVDLVETCLARIHQFESQVHAWVCVDEAGARQAAQESARELTNGGWRGPLHGIPFAVKDIFDVRGFPTKAGSRLRESHLAKQDCPVVARLRECGAIVLGKTVTTEFACFDPPVTRNPWNLAHTPGGSSSGSAAALAVEMCPLALGSQTGGSINRPAAYCGVAGIKPRYGSLPLAGIVPLAHHLDHPGMLARTAADLQVFWQAYHNHAPVESANSPRLLRLDGFFWDEASAEMRQATDEALALLAKSGAEIRSYTWPEITKVHEAHRRIITVEAAQYHRSNYVTNPQTFGPKIGSLIAEGLSTLAVDYADALHAQRELKGWLRETLPSLRADAFVLPAANIAAPLADTTGDPKFHIPWSYSGLPVVNLPFGLGTGGLPCGIQLVGLSDEAALLRTAAWCERQMEFNQSPKLLAG